MSKVVNLRTARKAQQRLAKRQKADQNAALHGRSKSQKKQEEDQAERSVTFLDGHKRDDT
ncbi:DUF4169 family protein [Actibacterium pelagium]|uniref:DUF4169 domain-containing protein n=1 Tax=Actibacterium pelagium TaxID=2029103 RepID=A0A917ACV3_9RHOB|nr:DUF4169 family protein [Actibacterium pelagium]GGE43425.1 hypothetical protein GCM10011517_08840 [Actibacterium pelagium]